MGKYYEVRKRNGELLIKTKSQNKAEKYLDSYKLDAGEGIKLLEIIENTVRLRYHMK